MTYQLMIMDWLKPTWKDSNMSYTGRLHPFHIPSIESGTSFTYPHYCGEKLHLFSVAWFKKSPIWQFLFLFLYFSSWNRCPLVSLHPEKDTPVTLSGGAFPHRPMRKLTCVGPLVKEKYFVDSIDILHPRKYWRNAKKDNSDGHQLKPSGNAPRLFCSKNTKN